MFAGSGGERIVEYNKERIGLGHPEYIKVSVMDSALMKGSTLRSV